ncbi:hypothetical protein GPJ56_007967 [Histomonas meleagridis]|uniref:uncharacterized protein n=1 Tax=Histomonas meleagridis TaxID=135588 RepID=UPI003559EDBB|nr:hypothetical protein GPJ56_007967 [Histomonas meleagridis]KAH0803909.1 hypothetical protein GO595_002739 [Histomonas meleagridis]
MKYISSFINCSIFENNCIEKAVKILLEYYKPDKETQKVFIYTFFPYLHKLESDLEAQETLSNLIRATDSTILYFVAAPFLYKHLPFTNVGKTYQQITYLTLTARDASCIFKMYSKMLTTASSPLEDAIFTISTLLLSKFKNFIKPKIVYKIYEFSLTKILRLSPAADFLLCVSSVNPGIVSLKDVDPTPAAQCEKVKIKMEKLIDTNYEMPPITKCNKLKDLRGLISQRNPPKIFPYASEYEMYSNVMDKAETSPTTVPTKKTPQISPSLSMITTSVSQMWMANEIVMTISPLKERPVKMELLDERSEENDSVKFVISSEEFLKL